MSLFSSLGRSDPTDWILESSEPAAHWIAITHLLGMADGAAEAVAARLAVLEDPATRSLLSLLPDWEVDDHITGHDRPLMATNQLDLLQIMGVRADDDPRIGRLLDQLPAHTDDDGRFQMFGAQRRGDPPRWGALLCDTHAIVDILLAFGRGDDARVRRALDTSLADLCLTAQGLGWPCRPSDGNRWRGPGRARDCCPQTTLEALRAFSRLSEPERPPEVDEAARTILGIWAARSDHKPYMFGHGRQFKQVKWPPTWYGAYEVVDTVGRLDRVWTGPDARPEHRRAFAEIGACLLAYNVAADGKVTPLSVFQGFGEFSFGRKHRPSPFATALVWAALKRLEPLAPEIAAVEVMALTSSKGGTGTPMPPKVAN